MATKKTPPGPSKETTTTTPQPRFDYAARQQETQHLIIRALKTRVERGNFSIDDAVSVAMAQIFRPRGPRLPEDKKPALEKALLQLASTLEPPTARAMYTFSKDAATLAWAAHPRPRSPLAPQEDAWYGAEELAKAALVAELASRGDTFGAEDLINRAVRRSLNTRRKARIGAPVAVKPGDPLRALLEVPPTGMVRLPGQDLRSKMARVFTGGSPMGDAVRRSAVFHSERMELVLGPDLWNLGRPVGFADRKQTKILIASSSSTAAQETQMRSQELVHRLQKVPGLEAITGVKVQVDAAAFHLFARE